MTCETRYETFVKLAGPEFIESTQKAQMSLKHIQYPCLSQDGHNHLEVVLALLFKERHIKHSPMMVSIASLLIIFMTPAEVYHVLVELYNSSTEAFKSVEV